MFKAGIGQDSHRFDFEDKKRQLVLGGVIIPDHVPLKGNSDADVVLHSLTNAISGITCVNILGEVSDRMCLEQGISDSRKYLELALSYIPPYRISNVSFSIECSTPRLSPVIEDMRNSISLILGITKDNVAITATSGEELTPFGQGLGIQVFCIVAAVKCEMDKHCF